MCEYCQNKNPKPLFIDKNSSVTIRKDGMMVSDVFFIVMGVVCFFIGYVFGKIFGCHKKKNEPCETLQDVIDREG